MFRFSLSKCAFFGVVFALAACGSSVKLSDVPVEDRTGTSAGAGAGVGASGAAGSVIGANAGSAAGRTVAPVALPAAESTLQGPSNVVRVIYFDYDSFVIKPEFQSVLDGHAKFLNANKARRVTLEGHTDESGGREYNLALGQKRAEAVRRSLGLLGVSEAQAEPVSFGEEKPASVGSSEVDYAKNRRAEIVYR